MVMQHIECEDVEVGDIAVGGGREFVFYDVRKDGTPYIEVGGDKVAPKTLMLLGFTFKRAAGAMPDGLGAVVEAGGERWVRLGTVDSHPWRGETSRLWVASEWLQVKDGFRILSYGVDGTVPQLGAETLSLIEYVEGKLPNRGGGMIDPNRPTRLATLTALAQLVLHLEAGASIPPTGQARRLLEFASEPDSD